MVEHQLPKLDRRVRFPLPAFRDRCGHPLPAFHMLTPLRGNKCWNTKEEKNGLQRSKFKNA